MANSLGKERNCFVGIRNKRLEKLWTECRIEFPVTALAAGGGGEPGLERADIRAKVTCQQTV